MKRVFGLIFLARAFDWPAYFWAQLLWKLGLRFREPLSALRARRRDSEELFRKGVLPRRKGMSEGEALRKGIPFCYGGKSGASYPAIDVPGERYPVPLAEVRFASRREYDSWREWALESLHNWTRSTAYKIEKPDVTPAAWEAAGKPTISTL